jgi:hypothetical protein
MHTVTAASPHIVFCQLSVSSENNLEGFLLCKMVSSYDVYRQTHDCENCELHNYTT